MPVRRLNEDGEFIHLYAATRRRIACECHAGGDAQRFVSDGSWSGGIRASRMRHSVIKRDSREAADEVPDWPRSI